MARLPLSPLVYLPDGKKQAVKPQTAAAVQSAELKMILLLLLSSVEVLFKNVAVILVSVGAQLHYCTEERLSRE